jgi:hypothetical protein
MASHGLPPRPPGGYTSDDLSPGSPYELSEGRLIECAHERRLGAERPTPASLGVVWIFEQVGDSRTARSTLKEYAV